MNALLENTVQTLKLSPAGILIRQALLQQDIELVVGF